MGLVVILPFISTPLYARPANKEEPSRWEPGSLLAL
jgi:hypothetical protein